MRVVTTFLLIEDGASNCRKLTHRVRNFGFCRRSARKKVLLPAAEPEHLTWFPIATIGLRRWLGVCDPIGVNERLE